jgi:hypothetical protein
MGSSGGTSVAGAARRSFNSQAGHRRSYEASP